MTLVVAGAVCRDGRVLLAQRAYPPELAGLWELPGGKVRPRESPADALVRELCEELDVTVSVGDRLTAVARVRADVELIAMRAQIVTGTPRALEHRALRWVDAAGLLAADAAGELVPADRVWVPELVADLQLHPNV